MWNIDEFGTPDPRLDLQSRMTWKPTCQAHSL